MEPVCGSSKNWCYRGEGNSSLVVANLQEKKVLRLRKCSIDTNAEKQEASRRDWMLCKDYIDNVMRPLLGEMFVASPELLKLSFEFVQDINRNCLSLRPHNRLHAHADEEILLAMLLPDACMLSNPVEGIPIFSVEIKCKQGFLPPYSAEKCKNKKPVCRFCMLQKLKVKTGSLNHRSKFCPLDIFSGNLNQMKHALKCLLQTPQNNLRIFKDGSLCFSCSEGNPSTLLDLKTLVAHLNGSGDSLPELETVEECLQSNVISVFTDVISKTLLHVKRKTDPMDGQRCGPMDKCAASSFRQSTVSGDSGLPVGCVLHSVLTAQRKDTSGVYGVSEDFERLCDYIAEHPHHREYLQLDGPYPEGYLTMDNHACIKTSENDVSIPSDVVRRFQRVRDFLVAGTSKDLSIMVAFQKVPNDASFDSLHATVLSHGSAFQHAIHIVDLDPKPSSRIPNPTWTATSAFAFIIACWQPESVLPGEVAECMTVLKGEDKFSVEKFSYLCQRKKK